MADDTAETPEPSADDKLIEEAKRRFKRCETWESVARLRFLEDVKFVNGDADNMYQWPMAARTARGFGSDSERPCLTVNKARIHCLQVINDARQNKTSIKVKPSGNGATYEAAQVLEGLVRHIEYISAAQSAYGHAGKFQVFGGIGYMALATDYVDNESFDQEIYIRKVDDPLKIYMDPDYRETDASDMRFAFDFADVPRDEFEIQYPQFKDRMAPNALGNNDGWMTDKHVRVAVYWYRNEVKDQLIVFADPKTGEPRPIKRSDTKSWRGDLRKALKEQLEDPATQVRDIIGHEVKFVKIVGDQILKRGEWAGTSIPIYPVIGEKTVIEGELDRKGHVRALKDSQRMLNYNASAEIEYGALQGKSPWAGPAAAFEGYETMWSTANTVNHAYLSWNHIGEDGEPIPPPFKVPPPTGAPIYQEGMQNAAQDMMMVSGQYQAVMGEPSNERSGKAIQERQRQGENATYHFIDHFAIALRRLGKDIIELAGKIYDTPRLIKIMGEDGKDADVMLDPGAKAAYEKRAQQNAEAAEQIVVNPSIGRYDVMSDVGPDFATRRQEAFNALSQIAAQNPELMSVIGDLVMLAADFPLADEAAERFRRMVPPQALGDGPNPQIQQLQGALQSTQGLMSSMSQKLIELQNKLSGKDAEKSIDVYKAITDRIKVLSDIGITPKDHAVFLQDLMRQEHAAGLDFVTSALQSQMEPEMEGA